MTKRFTDCEKWEDPWYMSLKQEEKLAFEYMLDKCSNIGIWKINTGLAEYCIGTAVDWGSLFEKLGPRRIRMLDNERLWIIGYAGFQYSVLDETSKSKPILSYIAQLKKERLWIPYQKGMGSLKEKEKDQEKEKEKEKDIEEGKKLIKEWRKNNKPKPQGDSNE